MTKLFPYGYTLDGVESKEPVKASCLSKAKKILKLRNPKVKVIDVYSICKEPVHYADFNDQYLTLT